MRSQKKEVLQAKRFGKFKDKWLGAGAGLIEVLSIDLSEVQDSPDETDEDPGLSRTKPRTVLSCPGKFRLTIERVWDLVENNQ